MPFIIHANGETRKRDSMENNILYLSRPLIKRAPSQTHPRRGQGEFTHRRGFYIAPRLCYFAASRTDRKYFCVSTLSRIIGFSIPTEMTAAHTEASLWLGCGVHSISIQCLISSCSAFSGSIIPTDPCLGCKDGLLWFQYSSPFDTFLTQ